MNEIDKKLGKSGLMKIDLKHKFKLRDEPLLLKKQPERPETSKINNKLGDHRKLVISRPKSVASLRENRKS